MHTSESTLDNANIGVFNFELDGIILRYATFSDMDDLLLWRNHLKVRLNSRNKDVIDLDIHAKWFAAVIADPARHLMIGYRDGKPIGVVRLDEIKELGDVSIYLTPDAHGQNNGTALLRAQEAWIWASLPKIIRLIAVVLSDNKASHRLFIKNGYTWSSNRYEKPIIR